MSVAKIKMSTDQSRREIELQLAVNYLFSEKDRVVIENIALEFESEFLNAVIALLRK
jgi:hypothetical protein